MAGVEKTDRIRNTTLRSKIFVADVDKINSKAEMELGLSCLPNVSREVGKYCPQ